MYLAGTVQTTASSLYIDLPKPTGNNVLYVNPEFPQKCDFKDTGLVVLHFLHLMKQWQMGQ